MDALKVQSHLTFLIKEGNGEAKNGNDCNAT